MKVEKDTAIHKEGEERAQSLKPHQNLRSIILAEPVMHIISIFNKRNKMEFNQIIVFVSGQLFIFQFEAETATQPKITNFSKPR